LNAAGMTVLSLDLRGHGESVEPASLRLRLRAQQRDPKLFRGMINDVEAAYRWLSRRPESDPARFALVGAMAGGNVALEYAARDKSVDGVVYMSPQLGGVGLEPITSARKYASRRLLLLATPDERVDAETLGRLVPEAVVKIVADRSTAASSQPETSPGTRTFGKAGKVIGAESAIRDFLVEAAGSPAADPVVASLKGKTFYEPSSSEAERLSPDNLRWFSSPSEAQARGYRPPKSRKK
jgi:pimeloyl-ACP methyl ester carboxylesterase